MTENFVEIAEPWFASMLRGLLWVMGKPDSEHLKWILAAMGGVFLLIGPLLGRLILRSRRNVAALGLAPGAFWFGGLLGWAAVDLYAAPHFTNEGLQNLLRGAGLILGLLLVGMGLLKSFSGMGFLRSALFIGTLSFLGYAAALMTEATLPGRAEAERSLAPARSRSIDSADP